MGENGYFAHVGLDGSQPWERIADAGYSGSTTGENIAAGSGTAEGTFAQGRGAMATVAT